MRQWEENDAQQVPPEYEEELLYSAVTAQWNRLAREAAESPSLEIFRTIWTQSHAARSQMTLPDQGDWTT